MFQYASRAAASIRRSERRKLGDLPWRNFARRNYSQNGAWIDTGPIVYQELFDIDDADTGLTLSAKCIRSGIALVLRLMETASADPASIPLTPQDLTEREYSAVKSLTRAGYFGRFRRVKS